VNVRTRLGVLRRWPRRRWLVVAGVTLLGVVVVGVPTDLLDTPFFRRDVPPQWWSWPSLIVSSTLIGLLAATYVTDPGRAHAPAAGRDADDAGDEAKPVRRGAVAGVLTFFAVGCPVCNKIVLLALGYAGALTWFQPVQPLLQLVAFVLLAWALHARLATATVCPTPSRRAGRAPQPADVPAQEP